jgi:CheY-like chemotaxis protein
VRQEISVSAGEQWLKTGSPDALLLSLSEGEVALNFLARLRAGTLPCEADLPVVAMSHEGDAALVLRLKELDVRRLLLQPFKLRDVIHTLGQLWPAPQALVA